MPAVRKFQTSFVSGQLSRRLGARVEQRVYEHGARELTNVDLMLQGGVSRRTGTLRRLALGSARSRMIGAVYTRAEAYLLVFAAGRCRVVAPDGTVVADFTSQPWTGDVLDFMTVRRYGNLTFIADQSFRPRVLTRTGPGTFSMANLQFDAEAGFTYQPYHKFAPAEVALSASGITGSITLTASAAVFVAGHVGLRFRIGNASVAITAVASATSATGTISGRLDRMTDPSPLTTTQGSTRVVFVMPDHGLWPGDSFTLGLASDVGGLDCNGTWTVAQRVDRDRLTFTHSDPADTNDTGGGPAVSFTALVGRRDWSEPVFSGVRGWPQTAEVHQSRLWLAGSPDLGDAAFGSRVQALFNFDQGDGEPDAAVKAVAQTQSNGLRHLISHNDLLALGDSGEAYFPGGDEGITQATSRAIPTGQLGCSYCPPIIHDGAVLFGDVMGLHVYEALFDQQVESYIATPLSALCPELITGPVGSCVYKGSRNTTTPCTLWTMADGTVAVFTSRRAEGAAGWVGWRTFGRFISVAALNERLYAIAEREVDGETEYWLEEFDFDRVARSDGCVNLTAEDPTRVWPSPFGPGVVVDVFDRETADYIGRAIGDGEGNIEIEIEATDVLIGLPFVATITTLPPAIALPEGPTFGRVQRISTCVVHFHETIYARIDGESVVARDAADVLGAAVPLTGPIATHQLGFRADPTVTIESDVPEPFTVLGALVEVQG